MNGLRLLVLEPSEFAPWAEQARALERSITYPIEGGADRFWIDHGPAYVDFYDGLGQAFFMVVAQGDRLVGVGSGAFRPVRGPGGALVPGFYGGDVKLHPDFRGKGVAAWMFTFGLRGMLLDRRTPRWRYAFAAAMRGERGDVTRSYRSRLHPGRLGAAHATLAVYFVAPAALRGLRGDGPTAPPGGADLGVQRVRPLAERTAGRKDLRLVSTGAPWPLVHLPGAPDAWGDGVGAWLRSAAGGLDDADLACFALDVRLEAPIHWLEEQGVTTRTRATVYAMAHPLDPLRGWRRVPWIHLPTSEI